MLYLRTALLGDDSKGGGPEAARYGFNTLVVSPTDAQWAAKVKARL